MAKAFFCLAGFAFFWYLSSYLVVNVEHRVTLLYTTIEAVAVGFVGGACYFWLRVLMALSGEFQLQKPLFYSLFIGTVTLIGIKYSSHLPMPVGGLREIKIAIWLSMTVAVMVFSCRLLGAGASQETGFTLRMQRWIALGGLLLPVAGLLDYFVIYDKFYEGNVRLSLNTPLFIAGFLIYGGGLLILLTRQVQPPPPPLQSDRDQQTAQLECLTQQYQITARETEVIKLVLQGKSNQEIAKALVISPATVKNHLHHIFGKMGIANRYELISLVWQENKPE